MLRSALLRPIRCGTHAQARCLSSSTAGFPKPWFLDAEPTSATSSVTRPNVNGHQVSASQGVIIETAILPPDLPEHLHELHTELVKLPLLEPGRLEIRPPLDTPPGPPLPFTLPRGRRRRGGTDAGVGVPVPESSLWKWIVLAQVKEGTEGRGAIESVLRVVRKTLLKSDASISLPPNRKRRVEDGWGMLDAGDFAVHVLNRTARQQYFPTDGPEQSRRWYW